MHLIINNVSKPAGQIYVAIYDKADDFLKTDKIFAQSVTPVGGTGNVDLMFADLPSGTYAISCFHDLNGNGRLDTNLLGIPTEPYGFSNNARPRFRAPSWAEAKFDWKTGGKAVSIHLEKW